MLATTPLQAHVARAGRGPVAEERLQEARYGLRGEPRGDEPWRGRAGPGKAWETAWARGIHPETGESVGRWYLPLSVRRCLAGDWSWLTKDAQGAYGVSPYSCGSWRCPRCSWRAAEDLHRRVRALLESHDPDELVFLTVTLPRKGSPFAAMESLSRAVRAFFKRVRYDLGEGVGRGRVRAELRWSMVFEAHKDPRWVHGHAIVHSRALARALRAGGWFASTNTRKGRVERRYRYVTGTMEPAARALGLGRLDAQPVASRKSLARYLTKLSREMAGAGAKGQLPILAPKRFRRVRSTPGFLPALLRDPAPGVERLLARAPVEAVERVLRRASPAVLSALGRVADSARSAAGCWFAPTAKERCGIVENSSSTSPTPTITDPPAQRRSPPP